MSSKKIPQFIAGLAACCGAFLVGTGLGWSSPMASKVVDNDQYFPINSSEWGWIASVFTAGCAFSCIPIGYLMNKFGRKSTMLGLVIPFLIGWALIVWAQNFIMLLIGRLLTGVAGGAFYISAPQYIAETAEKEIRGTIGSFLQLLISLGVLFAYTVGAYSSTFAANFMCFLCPIMFGIIFMFVPESPVYLIIENQEADAIKSLKWLRGNDYDPQDEIIALKNHLIEESNSKISFSNAIKAKSSISAFIIGIGLLFFRQMCGVLAILFFATTIFDAAGVGLSSDTSSIILGIMQFFSSILALLLVDKLGRKVLLLGSIFVMTITLAAIGTFFYIQSINRDQAESLGWLPLTSLCIYILAYPVGYGGVPWIVVSEVVPKNIKVFCSPIMGFFSWAMAFLVTLSFSSMLETYGSAVSFWIFAGISFIGIIFTLIMVPETKGKSLAEIEEFLGKKNNFT